MDDTADYLEIDFGPLLNRVENSELLDKAGALIASFLKAQGLTASPRIFCREKASAHPLLIIVTPEDSATEALDALEKSNACHPKYPFMDFKSVAVPVRNETGEEGFCSMPDSRSFIKSPVPWNNVRPDENPWIYTAFRVT